MKNRPSLHDIESFNKKREKELELEPIILEESSDAIDTSDASESELLKTITAQKDEINRISRELVSVQEQLKIQQTLLAQQSREISLLKEKQDTSTNEDEKPDKTRRADNGYNKQLILKNIVTLIEDKGFSFNDVARLFKLEGFLPPSPYEVWDNNVVEKLYAIAR